MKTRLHLGICAFLIFFTTAFSQVGNTCSDPIIITSLPYQASGNTGDYGDSFDTPQGTSCGAVPAATNYLAGNEVFYSYTPATNSELSISMTPTATNSSIFVYANCSWLGNTCVAGVANANSNSRSLTLNAVAGQPYIIVISSSGATQSFNYTLLVQEHLCSPKPVFLSASAITTTQAELSWNSGFFPSQEIAVQPLGSSIPTGQGQYTSNTDSLTLSDLSPGTQYQFWVRSECMENSGMFTDWAGPYAFNTQVCEAVNTCNYTFRLSTTSGAWGQTRMQVRQNGIVVAILGSTFSTGQGPVDVTVPLCNGVPFDLYWNIAGVNPQNKIIDVLNPFGQNIFSKSAGTGAAGTVVYSGTGNCSTPQCDIVPDSVSASDVTTSGAKISWSSPAITSWDLYVVPSGSPAPDVNAIPTHSGISTNPYTLNGLDDDTMYEVYVRANCAPIDSNWSVAGNFTTLPLCVRPMSLSVSLITATSASLSWQKGTPADNAWEILLVPGITDQPSTVPPAANPDLSNGSLLIPVSSASPLGLPSGTLTAATIYSYYIRTVCSPGVKSKWAGPFMFNTITCEPANKCNYKFVMTDTGVNGWNGARMQVRQNGIVIMTIGQTITGGGPTVVTVPLCNNVPFDLYWSVAGTAPEEIGVSIQNPYADIIYAKLPGQGNPLEALYSSMGSCEPPSCPKPSALEVTANTITQTSVQLAWTENGNAIQWEVYAVPQGGPQPINGSPVTGTGAYRIANTNPYTLTGLEPQTKYVYYVRSLCSDSDASTWPVLNPKTFTTKPVNDECAGAITVLANTSRDCTFFANGSTLGATRSLPNTAPVCPGNTDDDVWFSFLATSTTQIITISDIVATAPAALDINHTLYAGSDCSALTQLYCSNANVSVATNLTVGSYYKIRVYTAGGNVSESATFKICVTTPDPVTNDECSAAIFVPMSVDMSCSNAVHGAITGATPSAMASTCAGTEDDDVWFTFVAQSPTLNIALSNITGTTGNLVHSLYHGDCNSGTLLYCSDPEVSIAENLIIGDTYYIRVWTASNLLEDVTFDVCIRALTTPLNVSTTQYTPGQLVSNVLINNPCVEISNVTSTTGTDFGSVNGIGYFTNPISNDFFPLSSGLLLTTGDALLAGGHNVTILSEGTDSWTGDSDLEIVTNMDQASHNASVLEFDFTTPTAYMSFNFLFASEEYGSFQCQYSDAFAFLLTDLITGQTKNLAVLPDNITPISVITIRDQAYNDGCQSMNPEFFGHFFSGDLNNENFSAINFSGQTQVMTAASPIEPNHPYHIKLVIADRGDNAYDSAVFIQAGSFASGPPECTDKLKVTAFIDENANGTREDTEIPFTYGSFSYQQNNAGEINHISTPLGMYTLYDSDPLNTYDFNYVVDPEFQPYFSAGTTSFNDVNIPDGSGTTELLFPITVLQSYSNPTISILPISSPRPGFQYSNKIVYTNLGMTTTSGTITFTRDASVTIASISEPGANTTANGFTYDFSNLLPHETRSFMVTMDVPNIPVVHLGQQLTTSAVISAPSGDVNINNNTFSNTQTVIGSYDPNDKQESHGGKININQFTADDYLYYTIRFQNTGTFNALNVRIEDVLEAQIDPESIRMVSASHNYVMERIDNKVSWYFDYIQLPSMFQNEEMSHGYITFRVKLLPGFEVGDVISNTADIHFDANPPITTNTIQTTFEIPLATGILDASDILLFPNPASQHVQIALVNTAEDIADVTIFDMLGKSIVTRKGIGSRQTDINVSHLAKGVYMVEIVTENHLKQLKKLVIQ
ncbi:DUF7619 domain-containing protein [Flavobacterium pallidum]|uniref:Fibronectin type-III domain-containing protein n=1 Tax=Flavobacterium pallidum TaxID=2172098 RepID=A0A2S1SG96_9FLAO|nr:choice-of-anchor L domain-containing protein [Flavobacterium pallidum]AWI25436.1 hypothetical protein HYN49_05715 [Flavobacterium pallidum]